MTDKKIVFADGTEIYGVSFGDKSEKLCEIVFNTSMAGYQEILSDPSYSFQAVVMTYPLIGNYGLTADDYESSKPLLGALIVKDYCDCPSNFRQVKSVGEVLKEYGICGVSGVDTRKLTRMIRDTGSQKVYIANADTPTEYCVERILKGEIPKDLSAKASVKAPWFYPAIENRHKVAVIDCGIKKSIITRLNDAGCSVILFPHDTTAEYIESFNPDGVVISNGPGDPQDAAETIETVKKLIGKLPILGICLGHQIISLAYGAKTYKLKFGHRGGNHPVKNLNTGKIEITSQNHSYAVDTKSLENSPLKVTWINLLDGTAERVECEKDGVIGVQYHPEGAPGPHDGRYVIEEFTAVMERKNA